jgi:hypothetical protein
MNSTTLLTIAYQWGPVLFGIAFVAPLVAQTLEAGGFAAPFGVSEIQFGLVVGILGGLVAKRRGTWV